MPFLEERIATDEEPQGFGEGLTENAAEFRGSISAMKDTAAQLESKTWRFELVDYGKEDRGIISPKGVKVDHSVVVSDGRIGIVIKPCLAIDVFSVPYFDNNDAYFFILNPTQDTIIPYTVAPQI